MTDDEAIATVRAGGRCETQTTIHGLEDRPPYCHPSDHRWRTVACDSALDVIECSKCGAQHITRCDFDEEYA